MRIIAGEFRSRKLRAPADALTTRPIPDRVKESVFGLLRGHFEGARVVDCFAGTGSIGLEAISRGAEHCVFIEKDKRAAELLETNIRTLGCEDRCTVVRGDALGPAVLTRIAAMGGVDLIFMDPPYPLVRDPGPEFGGEGGWLRVRSQFERLVAVLSDKGFAVLRTPWPFRHADLSIPTDDHADGDGGQAHEPTDDAGTEPGSKHAAAHGARRGSPAGPGGRVKPKSGPRMERSWVIGSGGVGDAIDLEEIQESTRRLERKMRGGGPGKHDAAPGHGPGALGKRRLTIDDLEDDGGDAAEPGAAEPGAADAPDDAHADEDHADHAGPNVTYHQVDLAMAGAVGPETHVYASTAVHLYMRQR